MAERWFREKKRQPTSGEQRPTSPVVLPDMVELGDGVQIGKKRRTVGGIYKSESPQSRPWMDVSLQGGDGEEYLTFGLENPGERKAWWFRHYTDQLDSSALGLSAGQRLPDQLTHEGRPYALEEHGSFVTIREDEPERSEGTFTDYGIPPHRIGISSYDQKEPNLGAEHEIWAGQDVDPESISINPANTRRPRRGRLTGDYFIPPK